MSIMKPEKLSWVTVPLIVLFVLQVLGLLILPFLGAILPGIVGAAAEADPTLTTDDQMALQLVRVFTGATLWVAFFIGLAWAIFMFLTYRAVAQGKAWGRIAAVVIFILQLLSFPLGTILGIFGLIGAFDQGVQRYASR